MRSLPGGQFSDGLGSLFLGSRVKQFLRGKGPQFVYNRFSAVAKQTSVSWFVISPFSGGGDS